MVLVEVENRDLYEANGVFMAAILIRPTLTARKNLTK